MTKRQPLYPHVPKSSIRREAFNIYESLLSASKQISDAIKYVESLRSDEELIGFYQRMGLDAPTYADRLREIADLLSKLR